MPQRTSKRATPTRSPKPPVTTPTPADAMFRAFGDSTRLRILRLLQDGSLCVGDLIEILGAPQTTVSRHLAYLRRARLVTAQQHGLWMFYELARPEHALHHKLLACLEPCSTLVAEFRSDRERARRLRRSGGCCPEGRRPMATSRRRGSA